jgi:putative membrane protein
MALHVAAQGTTPEAKGTVQSVPAADILPVEGRSADTKAKGKLSDAEFVEKAATAGLAEVRISNLALDKSAANNVRSFASVMVKDHAAANQQLRAIAAAKGLSVPQTLDQAHMETINKMVRLSGSEFDEAYVNVMKQDHDSAIALFENAAGEPGLSKELRDFAISTLDTLRNHQLQAHNLPAGEIKSAR